MTDFDLSYGLLLLTCSSCSRKPTGPQEAADGCSPELDSEVGQTTPIPIGEPR